MKSWNCFSRYGSVLMLAALFAAPAFAGKLALNDKVSAGSWLEKSGISIAPLYVSQPDPAISFLSLEEATKAGVINVMETSDVNQLLVENKGKKAILLLAGEVVGGGKQNRMVGKDLLLGPGKIRRINCFCVEHGRWTAGAEKNDFKSANLMADKEIRQKAQKSGGSAANQSEVWAGVSKSLGAVGAASGTSNYVDMVKSEKYQDAEAIVKFFLTSFDDDPDLAGFAVAYNGQVQSLEYFASPGLASKYREKLIRSYVTSGLKELQGSKPISLEALKNFLLTSLADDVHSYKSDDDIIMESSAGDLESFELRTLKSSLVHYSRYRK